MEKDGDEIRAEEISYDMINRGLSVNRYENAILYPGMGHHDWIDARRAEGAVVHRTGKRSGVSLSIRWYIGGIRSRG